MPVFARNTGFASLYDLCETRREHIITISKKVRQQIEVLLIAGTVQHRTISYIA